MDDKIPIVHKELITENIPESSEGGKKDKGEPANLMFKDAAEFSSQVHVFFSLHDCEAKCLNCPQAAAASRPRGVRIVA